MNISFMERTFLLWKHNTENNNNFSMADTNFFVTHIHFFNCENYTFISLCNNIKAK